MYRSSNLFKSIRNITGLTAFIIMLSLVFSHQPAKVTAVTAADTQTFVSHWEGSITPDRSRSSNSNLQAAETVSFDITYNGSGEATAVTTSVTYKPATISGPDLACFTGAGTVTDVVEILPMFIVPFQDSWFFTGTKPHADPLTFTGVSAVIGPADLDGIIIPKDSALVTVERNYQVKPVGGGTLSLPCNWLGTAVCKTNCNSNVTLSSANYTVREAEGMIEITVNRIAFEPEAATVDYTTSNGTAAAGQDYMTKSGTISFAAGELSKTIQVPIEDDLDIEGEETFKFTLSNPSTPMALGAIPEATITIDDRPDLTINPFTVPIENIQQNGNRFVIPNIEVTVRNLAPDGVTLTGVPVQFTSGATAVHTETIAELDAGASSTFMFDWDITDLLNSSSGNANLPLKGVIDPANAFLETNEGNNQHSTDGSVDIQPQVIAVNPQFTLDGHYFLDNQSVSNLITVLVDWNGSLPGTGSAPFGTVTFELNGAATTKAGTAAGATHTYDMGADFNSSLACANNTLKIWAANGGVQSNITTIQPTVFPFPEWVEWASQNLPNTDASFETTAKAPLVEYAYDFNYPEPAFEANWDVPNSIPYLGGKKIGLLETQAGANALGRSDGFGEIGLSGGTGLGLAAVDIAGEIGGVGEVQFKCGESLDLLSTTLTLNVNATISREMGLADLFPPLAAAENWAVVGSIIAWINSTAEVNAELVPEIAIETTFEDNANDELEFKEGTGTGSIGMGATLSVAPVDGLEASVSGGGTPYVTVQVPAAPSYLKEVGINLDFAAMLEAWFFEASYQTQVNCNSNGGCTVDDGGRMPITGPTLITRDYAGKSYDIYLTPTRQADGETVLIANVYPRPETALAIRPDGARLIAAVHDDTSKAAGRGTEIRVLHHDGSSWSAPVNVTSDAQPDFNPALAFDGTGNGLLLWERSTLATNITPALDTAFAQSLEIYTSIWNGSTWTAPAALTNNGLMDHAPQLARGNDGAVIAAWQSNDGTDMMGIAGHPVAVQTAIWNGASWDTPTAAISGQIGVVKTELAVKSAAEATMILVKLNGDTELFYSEFNGTVWSSLTQITTNTLPDSAPQIAYDSEGNRHLIWRQGSELYWLKNSWDSADAQIIKPDAIGGGYLEMKLSADGNGNLALVWPSSNELMHMVYDGLNDSWSMAQPLTDSTMVEGALAPAFDPNGDLAIAYRSTVQTLEAGTNGAENVPTLGASSLAFLTQSVGLDLAVESIAISPKNPAPGSNATISAVVKNSESLAVNGAQIAFFDGATIIQTEAIPQLSGGMTTTISTTWNVPAAATSHLLRATADPGNAITETDETNNELELQAVVPDIEIDVVSIKHSPQGMTVSVRLKNSGVVASGITVLELKVDDPISGVVLTTINVSSIPAGDSETVTELVPAATLANLTGAQLWAVATTTADLTSANNQQVAPLHLLPDLLLTANDVAGGAGLIKVTVHNHGHTASSAVQLVIKAGAEVPTEVNSDYTGTVPAIPAGGSTTVLVEAPAGSRLYGLKIDPANSLAEISESNNGAVKMVEITAPTGKLFLPAIFR